MPNAPEPGLPTGPITVDPDLWNLKANPTTLEEAARAWRSLRDSAASADETVGAAARRVIGGGGWSGETAGSYDGHQRRITAAMADLAEDADKLAGALDEVAHLLRVNQDALDEQRDSLAAVPVTRGAELTFQPEDEDQAQLVRDAVDAAGGIRLHVEFQLAARKGVVDEALTRLREVADDWQPRTIRMVNLNVGQGFGNFPGNPEGTDPAEIGDIAQLIADQDADVVTLQEVFGVEVENLERELEERTGDEWTLYFGPADRTAYSGGLPDPRSLHTEFGNMVAVREGGAIESSEMVANHDLNPPGNMIDTPDGPVVGGQGRSALEVEITLAGR